MRHTKQNKHSNTITIAAIIIAILGVAYGIGQHREARMAAYAAEHNCEWHYSYYINEQPICK